MKALLEEIARGLVDHPEQVVVEESSAKGGILYQLTVAGDDRGKLIGRQGRTARALRALLHAASQKSGKHMALEISK